MLIAHAAMLGGALASLVDTRFGRAFPVGLGISASVVAALLLATEFEFAEFGFAVALFSFAWNFSQPYFAGLMSTLDALGRMVVLEGAVMTIGLGFGPALIAVVVGDELSHVVDIALMFLVVSLICMFGAIYLDRVRTS